LTTAAAASEARAGAATLVLASGQFLMTLYSSVMNVSITTVAKDIGTTVTGIQGAITAYTLVMAALGSFTTQLRRASRFCSSAGRSWRAPARR
jgi:hypothetical protein